MKLGRVTTCVLSIAFAASEAAAQSGASLTTSIERGAAVFAQSGTGKTVAVLNFPGNDQCLTRLSAFVSEQLTVDLANALGRDGTVVERSQILQLLQEDRLANVGLTAQEASRLGKRLGAHFLLIGTKTVLGSEVILNARMVSTDGGAMVKAFRISGSVPSELLALDKELEGPQQAGCSRSAPRREQGTASVESREEPSIAVTDVGSLRVALASATLLQVPDGSGRTKSAIRVSIELTNNEVEKPLYVALNATNVRRGDGYNAVQVNNATYGNCGIGVGHRSSLVDSNGNSWSILEASGVGTVGIGCINGNGEPSEIASAMVRQERLNGAQLPVNAQYAYGTPSSINAAGKIRVGLTYIIPGTPRVLGNPEKFQFSCELVVGTVERGNRTSYALHNVEFDNVRLTLPPR